MTKIEEAVQSCKILVQKGTAPEDLVQSLRAQGFSKTESIRVLAEASSIGLGEAKEIVHMSPAWRDVQKRDDKFHDALAKNVKGHLLKKTSEQ